MSDLNDHRMAETAYPIVASFADAVASSDDDVGVCNLLNSQSNSEFMFTISVLQSDLDFRHFGVHSRRKAPSSCLALVRPHPEFSVLGTCLRKGISSGET